MMIAHLWVEALNKGAIFIAGKIDASNAFVFGETEFCRLILEFLPTILSFVEIDNVDFIPKRLEEFDGFHVKW